MNGAWILAPGVQYQLTDQDVLWAARAAAFEGGEPADVLWTLTQRFVLRKPAHPDERFADFVLEFSQPINPDWSSSGSHCRPAGTHYWTPSCDPERLVRREYARVIEWPDLLTEFPEAARATIAWANGELTNPVPRATNFASPSVAKAYLDRHPEAELLVQRGNWFISEGPARNWAPDHVSMLGQNGNAVATATGVRRRTATTAMGVFVQKLMRPFPWA